MGEEAGEKHEVQRTLADDLIGEMHAVSGLHIARLGRLHRREAE